MSETNTITLAEFNKRLLEDNKELIRIIGTALYPADIQLVFYQKARNEIRTMDLEYRESFALKVQDEAIKWEEENITHKSYW